MIQAILLDLGKVIVPFDFSIGYRALQARCGLEPDSIRERIRATGLVPRFETGLVEPREFVKSLCREIGVDLNYSEFCEIWSSIFSRETLLPDAFLASLHRRYRLVLVSNTNAIHFEMIRDNYPLLAHFDECVLSYEVQAMKPSARIFEAAVRAARCPPDQCFFTDDIQEYVDGARSYGIDAVLFQGLSKLENDLLNRGVTWE